MANNPNLYEDSKATQFKPGNPGGGKTKGSVHLKTLIQNIGNNIDWDKTTLKDKAAMKERYGNNAWQALTYVAFTKAMAGDPKAMDWLSKNGYGQNIDVTSNGETIKGATIGFAEHPKDVDTNTELS